MVSVVTTASCARAWSRYRDKEGTSDRWGTGGKHEASIGPSECSKGERKHPQAPDLWLTLRKVLQNHFTLCNSHS